MKKIMVIIILFQSILVMDRGSCMEEERLLQNLSKAELHLHLGGSFPKEYLCSISSPEQQRELERNLNTVSQRVDYYDVFRVFQIISQIVNTEEKLQRGVEALCFALQADNVSYVEIRTGLKDLGRGHEEYLKAVLAGIRANTSERFKANVVLSLQRNSSSAFVEKTIDLALKYHMQGVVGIDISGESTNGQIDRIMPDLLRAKGAGLSFVVHMGEALNETDQMFLLTMLQPKRIGHGVHLSHEAKEWILKYKTPIEVCLTSSLLVQMVDRYDQHPGIEFFQLGHPIVFCTDDPLLFSTTASKELLLAHQFCGFSIEDLKKIVHSAFHYALAEVEMPSISSSLADCCLP
jgi:adenosine deaminase